MSKGAGTLMTDAREIIAEDVKSWLRANARADLCSASIVARLSASGHRILAPGELDKETVEKCAAVAENHGFACDIDWWMKATKKDVSAHSCRSVAAAIRSLEVSNG